MDFLNFYSRKTYENQGIYLVRMGKWNKNSDIKGSYSRKKLKLRRIFINTRIPLRTSEWDGEYQQYLLINTSNFANFRFSMKSDNLIITLDIIKLDKHFVYYLIDLLKLIDKNKI